MLLAGGHAVDAMATSATSCPPSSQERHGNAREPAHLFPPLVSSSSSPPQDPMQGRDDHLAANVSRRGHKPPRAASSCPEGSLTGINPGKSHGQGPWVSHERHRLDDSSSANKRIRSCSILLLGEMRIQGMPRLERTRLGLQMVLDGYDVSPPIPYILR